ncbi:hypothetical protein TBK1r_64310 [Stieleria magnilauensis]|uniref:Secreted protein n=1 Tax=Stieleria magnilauensis TaxID=2527963 RepID=A0ABX5Y050_9BACT|nr:hypothetical protein TBK1r_64310 [Planctomycetes bacterium TBK1r]
MKAKKSLAATTLLHRFAPIVLPSQQQKSPASMVSKIQTRCTKQTPDRGQSNAKDQVHRIQVHPC